MANSQNLGIHLTQVTPIYSMRAHGGLPSDRGGLRGALPLGAGLPGVSVPAPLAGGIPMPALRFRQGLAAAFRSPSVCGMRPPSFADGRNRLPGHAHPADGLVPGDVVGSSGLSSRRWP